MEVENTLPLVIGHRGSPRRAPENSFAGLMMALDEGADMIELDVQMTADGTPVVFHDDNLERLCGRTGRVDSLTDKQLKNITLKNRFGPALKNETIPHLKEVLEAVADRGAQVNIEIKDARTTPEVVRLVQELRLHHQVVVSCFDWAVLKKVRGLDAGIHTGALYQFHLLPQEALKVGVVALHPYYLGLMSWQVGVAHGLGLMVNAWTVNRIQAWERLLAMGVDGIITDSPGLLRKWLNQQSNLKANQPLSH